MGVHDNRTRSTLTPTPTLPLKEGEGASTPDSLTLSLFRVKAGHCFPAGALAMRTNICGEPILWIDLDEILRLDVPLCRPVKTTKTR